MFCVSGTDKDGRHDILHEITRHGRRASCHDTKEHSHAHSKHHASARRTSTCHATGVVALRFARTALRDRPRPEWYREERRPCGAITFTRSPRCATDGLRSCVIVQRSMRAASQYWSLTKISRGKQHHHRDDTSTKTRLVMEAPLHWRKV